MKVSEFPTAQLLVRCNCFRLDVQDDILELGSCFALRVKSNCLWHELRQTWSFAIFRTSCRIAGLFITLQDICAFTFLYSSPIVWRCQEEYNTWLLQLSRRTERCSNVSGSYQYLIFRCSKFLFPGREPKRQLGAVVYFLLLKRTNRSKVSLLTMFI